MNDCIAPEDPDVLEEAPAGKTAAVPALVEELRQRYTAQMDAMAEDANERRMLPVFVDAAAWQLAAIAYRCGPVAAGDVIRQFGVYLHRFALIGEAQREAEQAKADGRLPH